MSPEKVIDKDEVFRALASSQRREILRILAEESDPAKTCCASSEVCACRFAERLDLAPSTVSHHMSILRRAGLVTGRKEGLWVHYTLQRDVLEAIADELATL